jgi:hypothetical protein
MRALSTLQREFQAQLLQRHGAIAAELTPMPGVDVSARVRIYERGYEERLVDALRRACPALRVGLGAERFDELGRAFVRATPSVHRSIREYGGELSAFLAGQELGEQTRCWSELAAWEWLLMDVFDAAGGPLLTLEALVSVRPEDWGQLHFAPHPTLRRFRSSTNVVELWRCWNADGKQAEVAADSRPGEVVADAQQPVTRSAVPISHAPPVEWLLWRRELTTHYRSLADIEARALDALRGGASFADLCTLIAETETDEVAALRSAQLLRGWIESGLIAAM